MKVVRHRGQKVSKHLARISCGKFNVLTRSASLQKSSFKKILLKISSFEASLLKNIKFYMVIFLASIVCFKVSQDFGIVRRGGKLVVNITRLGETEVKMDKMIATRFLVARCPLFCFDYKLLVWSL